MAGADQSSSMEGKPAKKTGWSLQMRLTAVIGVLLLAAFIGMEAASYQQERQAVLTNAWHTAEQVHGILMATRRIYQQQFLDSGLPITEQTVGFMPAHALSRISIDFSNWSQSGIRFNNVSDRPRNPANLADPIEMEAIRHFRDHPAEEVWMREVNGEHKDSFFHYARPIWVEAYCLKCHGNKAEAPAGIQKLYDDGYDYQMGELRGILSIKIPYTSINQRILKHFLRNLQIYLAVLFFTFMIFSYVLWRSVGAPFQTLLAGIGAIRSGRYSQRIEGVTGEFAQVGVAFNRMTEAIGEAMHERRAAEAQLQRARDALEETVQKKTSDLRHTNRLLMDKIRELEETSTTLTRLEGQWRRVIDTMPVMLEAIGADGEIVVWNRECERITGYTMPEVSGDVELQKHILLQRRSDPRTDGTGPAGADGCHSQERTIVCADGSEKQVAWCSLAEAFPIAQWASWSIGIDITERKMAQNRLLNSLEEKDALVREMHHRVKNNLQVISSLLTLQSNHLKKRKASKEAALEALLESCNRVRSMSQVHERLYRSENLSRVDFRSYVEYLASDLLNAYGITDGRVALDLNIDPINLTIDLAIPCGLIINELISNGLKHAFSDGRRGTIRVCLKHDPDLGRYELIVANDGAGFPADFDWKQSDSLGLQLVNTLIGQIRGEGALTTDGESACFTIRFTRNHP